MKNKGSKKSAIRLTSFCITMLIFWCLYVASNIYMIIVDGWDYIFALCATLGAILVVLWSIDTNIRLKFLRELKNKPCEQCRIVDVEPLKEYLKEELSLCLENEHILEIINIVNKIQKEEKWMQKQK